MLPLERQEIILHSLEERGEISITELSSILRVTLNIVRTDLTILEKDGVIVRIRGGVTFPSSNVNTSNNSIGTRYLKNLMEKRLIAKDVVKSLPKNVEFSLFMDSSTSTLEVAYELANVDKRCTVITHFTNIAQILGMNSNISVVLCGGTWWTSENCAIGIETLEILSRYHVDIALIGCTGIKIEEGIFNGNIETVPIKQKMIKNASQTWLLCDSTKFDSTSLLKIADFPQIARIFTNTEPSQDWKLFSQKKGFLFSYPHS